MALHGDMTKSFTETVASGIYKETLVYEPMLQWVRNKSDAFEARPDDILLLSYPKCGTTWSKALLYSIVHYDDERDPLVGAPFIHHAVPTVEYSHGVDYDALPSPRIYHSHLPLRAIPVDIKRKRCKIIYVARNVKDMLVSRAAYQKHLAQTGGTKEIFWFDKSDAQESLADLAERNAADLLVGRETFAPFARHTAEALAASLKAPEKIIFLRFEELIANYEAQVRSIVRFLSIRSLDNDEQAVRCICERTAFAQLKATEGVKWPTANSYFIRGGASWTGVLSEETAGRVDRFIADGGSSALIS